MNKTGMKCGISLILALFLFVCCPGCDKIGSNDHSKAVMLIDGAEVSELEFNYQLYSVIYTYSYYNGGKIDWNAEYEGKLAGESFKQQAANTVILFRAVEAGAKKLGCSLTEEEYAAIDADIAEQSEQAGGEEAFAAALAEQSLNPELYRYIIAGPELYYKVYRYLYGEDGTNPISDEEAAARFDSDYFCTKHIMLSLCDDDGNPLSEEAQAEKRTRIEEAYARALAGEDFDALMAEYNEDTGVNGDVVVFEEGSMPESYVNATQTLDYGDMSDIVTVDNSLYVILRVEADDAVRSEYLETVREECGYEKLTMLTEEWAAELKIEYTDRYYELDAKTVYESFS